jgi:hypothetical protein
VSPPQQQQQQQQQQQRYCQQQEPQHHQHPEQQLQQQKQGQQQASPASHMAAAAGDCGQPTACITPSQPEQPGSSAQDSAVGWCKDPVPPPPQQQQQQEQEQHASPASRVRPQKAPLEPSCDDAEAPAGWLDFSACWVCSLYLSWPWLILPNQEFLGSHALSTASSFLPDNVLNSIAFGYLVKILRAKGLFAWLLFALFAAKRVRRPPRWLQDHHTGEDAIAAELDTPSTAAASGSEQPAASAPSPLPEQPGSGVHKGGPRVAGRSKTPAKAKKAPVQVEWQPSVDDAEHVELLQQFLAQFAPSGKLDRIGYTALAALWHREHSRRVAAGVQTSLRPANWQQLAVFHERFQQRVAALYSRNPLPPEQDKPTSMGPPQQPGEAAAAAQQQRADTHTVPHQAQQQQQQEQQQEQQQQPGGAAEPGVAAAGTAQQAARKKHKKHECKACL